MDKETIKKTLETLRNKEAWKIVSSEMKFTPELIQIYEDEIDWNELSANSEMLWSLDIVTKYQEKINWQLLSETLFSWEDKLANIEHLKIVRNFPQLLNWDDLSGSCLPTRKEYMKEFAEHWNWERIAYIQSIVWTNDLFIEFEDKLLPILSNLVDAENCSDNSKKRHYQRGCFPEPLGQLIENDADKIKIKILEQLSRTDEHTDNQHKITIRDLINKESFKKQKQWKTR